MPQVYAFIESRCAELGLARGLQLRLALIAEELFLNAVLHGRSPTPIGLELSGTDAEVEFRITDAGAAFNPFREERPAMASADPLARPVGGLGLTLTVAMTCRRSYERVQGRNHVCVAIAKQQSASFP